jgi:hypothetical protein
MVAPWSSRLRLLRRRSATSSPEAAQDCTRPRLGTYPLIFNRLQEQPRPSIWGEINFINGSPDPLPENFIDGSPDPLPENFHRCFSRPVAGSSISIDGSPDPLPEQKMIDAPFALPGAEDARKIFFRAGASYCFGALRAEMHRARVCLSRFGTLRAEMPRVSIQFYHVRVLLCRGPTGLVH